MKPRVVILAAGASSRLGEPKALARIGPRTALEHLLLAARVVDARPLVVVGAHAAEIRAALDLEPCEFLTNDAWAAGRSSAVVLARSHCPERDLCISPVDVPLARPEVFASLARAWTERGAPPWGWLAPRHAASGRHGHPIVVGRALAATLEGSSSLRELRSRARERFDVAVDDDAVLDDLDSAADLARLRSRFA